MEIASQLAKLSLDSIWEATHVIRENPWKVTFVPWLLKWDFPSAPSKNFFILWLLQGFHYWRSVSFKSHLQSISRNLLMIQIMYGIGKPYLSPIYVKHFEEHFGICQLVLKRGGERKSWARWCVLCPGSQSNEQVIAMFTIWTLNLMPWGGTWAGNLSNLFSHIFHSCHSPDLQESSWP